MNLVIVEGFGDMDKLTPDMKYYAFDWDDNLMYMPTKIILKDPNGNEVGMGTEEFAEYRTQIGQEPFDYKGKQIVGFSENPFRNFRVEGDKRFLIDSMMAKPGPAWQDFVECVNGGSIFSIITARGHNPKTLALAVRKLIDGNINGLSKKELVWNLRKYNKIAQQNPDVSDDRLVDFYVFKLCKYYPVTFGEGSASNPEELKVKAAKDFQNYVKSISEKIGGSPHFKNEISNRFVPKIGFSDDDLRNLKTLDTELTKDPENLYQLYSTHGGEKKPYKTDN
jgi:hypothetical protein